MRIAENAVVTIDYTLKDADGEIIDSSDGDEPLTYLHGHGQIVPGLEKALSGRSQGAAFDIVVIAADGYGEWDETQVLKLPRKQFPPKSELVVGNGVSLQNERGEEMEFVIAAVTEAEVTLDGNHPLAGMDLHFSVSIRNVRHATLDEIKHGHAHGPGGHDHG